MKHIDRPGHRPGRTGHLILQRLAAGRTRLEELQDALGVCPASRDGQRLRHLILAMRRDWLIGSGRPNGMLHITDQGRCALRRLDAGEVVEIAPAPSIRIFSKEQASA